MRIGNLLGAALGAVIFGAAAAAPAHGEMPTVLVPARHCGKGKHNRRGTGKHSPPKSRPNRLTISKRVRRKHRRAA